MAHFLQGFGNF